MWNLNCHYNTLLIFWHDNNYNAIDNNLVLHGVPWSSTDFFVSGMTVKEAIQTQRHNDKKAERGKCHSSNDDT